MNVGSEGKLSETMKMRQLEEHPSWIWVLRGERRKLLVWPIL